MTTPTRTKKLADKLANEPVTAPSGATLVRKLDPAGDLIASMEDEFRRCLPAVLPWDMFARVALTGFRKVPRLIECTRPSLLGALMECARLGLEPMTEYATLTPFKNRKKGNILECQLIVGYQGYVQLMYRSGQVERVEAEIVYEADEYEHSIGDGGRFFHKPADHLPPAERGEAIRAYAFANLVGGGRTKVAVTPRWRAEEMRKQYGNVWDSDFFAMWMKTPLRQIQKFAPKSAELRRALAVDGATLDLGGIVDRPEDDGTVEGEVVEQATEREEAPTAEQEKAAREWADVEVAKPADAP